MSPKSAQKIRGEVTRETIIEIAEGFWAEHGIHNASLRQISAAAGLSNPSSVQYHFGGRDGLIQAVFEYRLPALDRRRGELLARAVRAGHDTDLHTLVDCIYRPMMEVVDAKGRPSYAAFLRQVLLYEPALLVRVGLVDWFPNSKLLTDRVLGLLGRQLPPAFAHQRLWASTLLLLSAVIRQASNTPALPPEAAYLDALDMVVAGLQQALRPSLRANLPVAASDVGTACPAEATARAF